MRSSLKPILAILFIWCLLSLSALAVSTKSIRDGSYDLFSQGELEGMALSSEGYLLPTYAHETLGNADAPIVWDALRESDTTLLAATGHEGRLMRLIDATTSETVLKVDDPELTALIRVQDGVLAAGAPSGNLYKVTTDDAATTYATLEASFVWRLLAAPDGRIWAATGPEGKLFRFDPRESEPEIEEVADLPSANLLDLYFDEQGVLGERGMLYVGGQDPGWLYRINPEGGDVEVVYNSGAEEIRAIEAFDFGLALALNTERAPSPNALRMTMRMNGGQQAAAGGDAAAAQAQAQQSQQLEAAFAKSQGNYGAPRSEIVILSPDGFARKLWTAPERPIHDLADAPGKALFAAAGSNGRLFEIDEKGNHIVAVDVREDHLLRILSDADRYLVTAARNGLVFSVDSSRTDRAEYLSRAVDAGTPVQWGLAHWSGRFADAGKVSIAFRLGNSGDLQSEYWSPWSDEQTITAEEPVALPGAVARFLQYKLIVEPEASKHQPLRTDYLEFFFKETNARPELANIQVQGTAPQQAQRNARARAAQAAQQQQAQAAQQQQAASGGVNRPNGNGQPQILDTEARSNPMQLVISWQAADPNQDAMIFKIYYRAEDETAWKVINDEWQQPKLPLDVSGVADGRYRFKIEATDAPDNIPGEELVAEAVSDQVIIDNTAPRFESVAHSVKSRRAYIEFEVVDELSLVASVQMDIDNGEARPLVPTDRIFDEQRERFEWRTRDLEPGEHTITLIATDRSGNSKVQKIVVNVDN